MTTVLHWLQWDGRAERCPTQNTAARVDGLIPIRSYSGERDTAHNASPVLKCTLARTGMVLRQTGVLETGLPLLSTYCFWMRSFLLKTDWFASVCHLWCQPLTPHLNWLPASILPDSAGLYLCDLTLSGNDVRRGTYGQREAPHLACVYLAALDVTGQVWPVCTQWHQRITMQLRFFLFFFLFVCSTYCYSQGKAGV